MAEQEYAFEAKTLDDLATIWQTSNEIGFDLVYRQLSKGEYCGQSKIVAFPETAIWRESHNQHVLLSGANLKKCSRVCRYDGET